ncbi:T-cell surface glycoprotein CD4-like [Elgaria multicarinata webbii]|uniref:T-cell surface glycoprotein CD4-like n=1 Tax=Elgaria multicarinata webbii TaxID=159646 RepID=UPI002FCCE8FE
MKKVTWRHKNTVIINFVSGKVYTGGKLVQYRFGDTDKGNFSLVLPDAKEGGYYACEVEGQQPITFDLKVWKLTQSPSGYLLQGETLLLELHSSNMSGVSIEWFGPSKAKVTGKEPRWKLKSNNQKLEIMNLTVQEDHGTWECRILPNGPRITYNVKVIGFSNASDDMAFAALNSSTVLSCPLNTDLQKEPGIPGVQAWKWMKNNMILVENLIPINSNSSFPVRKIPKVQFEDAGRHQCILTFPHRNLKKTIHLVVMKVSAGRLELPSKEPTVTLCCHISAPAPPMAQLCWVSVSHGTACDSNLLENKFCHTNTTGGPWRCDLKVNNRVELSMNYTVAEAAIQNKFPQIEVATGAGAMLLLFIVALACVPTCKTIKRKRQTAKRMTQAKQHLLVKRTCQCQRELTNDYYHD